MKLRIPFSALCISALSLFACAGGHHAPFTGESERIRKICAIEKRLQKAVSASPFLSMEVIGTVGLTKTESISTGTLPLPIMVGGATSMFAGCAAMPPPWLKDKYAIDIQKEAGETTAELGVKPLPEHLRGRASTRIAQAAKALGHECYPQPKFMNPARCRNAAGAFNCQATCLLGCRCGAKWNAAERVDEAVSHGAVLKTGACVKGVLIEGGQAVGVEGKSVFNKFTARANTVVIAAGGMGSPRILQNSGFKETGDGITMDTTTMVYGFTRQRGTVKEPPMTWSWENVWPNIY